MLFVPIALLPALNQVVTNHSGQNEGENGSQDHHGFSDILNFIELVKVPRPRVQIVFQK